MHEPCVPSSNHRQLGHLEDLSTVPGPYWCRFGPFGADTQSTSSDMDLVVELRTLGDLSVLLLPPLPVGGREPQLEIDALVEGLSTEEDRPLCLSTSSRDSTSSVLDL